jgi:hypothetical protein
VATCHATWWLWQALLLLLLSDGLKLHLHVVRLPAAACCWRHSVRSPCWVMSLMVLSCCSCRR